MGADISRTCGGGISEEEKKKLDDFEQHSQLLEIEQEKSQKLTEEYIKFKEVVEPQLEELEAVKVSEKTKADEGRFSFFSSFFLFRFSFHFSLSFIFILFQKENKHKCV